MAAEVNKNEADFDEASRLQSISVTRWQDKSRCAESECGDRADVLGYSKNKRPFS
ncbi:hypothetical protein [Nitrosomonas mobilis]|uniref:hypothetical protein n=1 Tax=Nitrosomonas mobilis TaxID=51642 RepID=UPI001C40ABD7|nr:hypothetical protein [Nitrosomonas mobilis]